MEAQISRLGDITVVHLRGHLDYETAEPFRKNFLDRLKDEKVVFDLKELSFVGSSGITLFLDALSAFCIKRADKTKFSSVGSEFRKIFAASPLGRWELYDNPNSAVYAFEHQLKTNFVAQSDSFPTFQSETTWLEDDEDSESDIKES